MPRSLSMRFRRLCVNLSSVNYTFRHWRSKASYANQWNAVRANHLFFTGRRSCQEDAGFWPKQAHHCKSNACIDTISPFPPLQCWVIMLCSCIIFVICCSICTECCFKLTWQIYQNCKDVLFSGLRMSQILESFQPELPHCAYMFWYNQTIRGPSQ